MKKLPILFVAVVVAAALSAFTAKQADTLYYRNADGDFVEKPETGICDEGQYHCTYIWTGAADPGDPQNPGNYQAQGPSSRLFVPTQP